MSRDTPDYDLFTKQDLLQGLVLIFNQIPTNKKSYPLPDLYLSQKFLDIIGLTDPNLQIGEWNGKTTLTINGATVSLSVSQYEYSQIFEINGPGKSINHIENFIKNALFGD